MTVCQGLAATLMLPVKESGPLGQLLIFILIGLHLFFHSFTPSSLNLFFHLFTPSSSLHLFFHSFTPSFHLFFHSLTCLLLSSFHSYVFHSFIPRQRPHSTECKIYVASSKWKPANKLYSSHSKAGVGQFLLPASVPGNVAVGRKPPFPLCSGNSMKPPGSLSDLPKVSEPFELIRSTESPIPTEFPLQFLLRRRSLSDDQRP